MKFCRKDQKDHIYDFAYSTVRFIESFNGIVNHFQYLILHFVSDRSRGGQGFVVEYSLGKKEANY